MKKKVAFLDRDGTLNVDKGYSHKKEECILTDGCVEALSYLRNLGFELVVITNQSGIARGYFKEENVLQFNEELERKLIENGVYISKFYFCPHHVDGKIAEYSFSCNCRKPEPGMYLSAIKEFNIDLKTSICIGDKYTDLLAGARSGLGSGILISRSKKEENLLVNSLSNELFFNFKRICSMKNIPKLLANY